MVLLWEKKKGPRTLNYGPDNDNTLNNKLLRPLTLDDSALGEIRTDSGEKWKLIFLHLAANGMVV